MFVLWLCLWWKPQGVGRELNQGAQGPQWGFLQPDISVLMRWCFIFLSFSLYLPLFSGKKNNQQPKNKTFSVKSDLFWKNLQTVLKFWSLSPSLFQGTLMCVFQQNPSLDANFSKNNNNKTKKLDHKCTGWLFSQNVVILCSFIHFMIGEHTQLWRSEKQRNKKGHKCILWLFQNQNQILFLLI